MHYAVLGVYVYVWAGCRVPRYPSCVAGDPSPPCPLWSSELSFVFSSFSLILFHRSSHSHWLVLILLLYSIYRLCQGVNFNLFRLFSLTADCSVMGLSGWIRRDSRMGSHDHLFTLHSRRLWLGCCALPFYYIYRQCQGVIFSFSESFYDCPKSLVSKGLCLGGAAPCPLSP